MNKSRAIWMFSIGAGTVVMIVLGGLVRLTGSGLSITEWDLITGVVPPLSEQAWEDAFALYQESPEYQKINFNMTLDEYQFIYFMEWLHRLLGRLLGLVFVLPLFFLLLTRRMAWRESVPYLWIGLGLAFQGWLGWYMVASGLVDRPDVSHYRLAAHLVSALVLLGLSFWVGLDELYGRPEGGDDLRGAAASGDRQVQVIGILAVVTFFLQVIYGAFVAGLDAGHVSNTWPRMFGMWIPRGMFSAFESFIENAFANPTAVHFIHRWFAFAVLGFVVWLWWAVRRSGAGGAAVSAVNWSLGFVVVQVVLGVSVVLFNVPIWLASLHQATAIGIFLSILAVLHVNARGHGGEDPGGLQPARSDA